MEKHLLPYCTLPRPLVATIFAATTLVGGLCLLQSAYGQEGGFTTHEAFEEKGGGATQPYLPTRAIAPTLYEVERFMQQAYTLGLCYDSLRWAEVVARYNKPLAALATARCEVSFGQYEKALETLTTFDLSPTPYHKEAHTLKGRTLLLLAERAQFTQNTEKSEGYLRQFFANHRPEHHPRYAYLMRQQARLQTPDYKTPAYEPLKVGVLLPLSGPAAPVGESMERALMLNLFNTTTPFELYPEDTANTPEEAAKAFARLKDLGVDVVLGPVFSQNVQAVAPLAEEEGIPFLAYSSDQYAKTQESTYLFSILPAEQARLMARYAVDKLGLRVFSALVPNTPYGQTMLAAFKETLESLGATLDREATFDLANPDLKRQLRYLTRMQEAEEAIKTELEKLENIHNLLGSAMDDADLKRLEELRKAEAQPLINYQALFVPAPAAAMPLVASQLAFYDSDGAKVQLLGTAQWDSPTLLLQDGQSYLNRAYYPATPPKVQTSFAQDYVAAFGAAPHPLASLAYDSLTFLSQLVVQGFTKGKDFAKYAQTLKYAYGTTGPYQLENGTLQHGYSIMQLRYRKGALAPNLRQEAPFVLPDVQGGSAPVSNVSEYLQTEPKKLKRKSFWQGIFGN